MRVAVIALAFVIGGFGSTGATVIVAIAVCAGWGRPSSARSFSEGRLSAAVGSCKLEGLARGGNNSVVECDLAKVEVAGSNPVSRSNFWRSAPPLRGGAHPRFA